MFDIPPGRWEGLEGLGDDLLAELHGKAEGAVVAAGAFLASEIKVTLSGPRHGRAYRVSRTGALHIASAPGEPPAVLHGNLRNSIGFSRPEWEDMTVSVEVGPGLGKPPAGGPDPDKSYARRLEWGGISVVPRTVSVLLAGGWVTVKAGTVIRILPRPYMEPTVLRVGPQVEAMLERLA